MPRKGFIRLGQQATAKAISAMPVTRTITAATPEGSTPSNRRTTSVGRISKPAPVAASLTAARISTRFIAVALPDLSRQQQGRQRREVAVDQSRLSLRV